MTIEVLSHQTGEIRQISAEFDLPEGVNISESAVDTETQRGSRDAVIRGIQAEGGEISCTIDTPEGGARYLVTIKATLSDNQILKKAYLVVVS